MLPTKKTRKRISCLNELSYNSFDNHWLLKLLTFLFIIIRGIMLMSYILSNTGWVELVHEFAFSRGKSSTSLTSAVEKKFNKVISLENNNMSAHRGIGFVYWLTGRDLQALDAWDYVGLTEENYVQYGKAVDDVDEALRWYSIAELVDPKNPELWLQVGKICQRNPSVDDICERFLTHNEFNWLVDPEFAFDQTAWRFNRRDGADYAIVTCPDVPGQKCARVKIYAVTSSHGTSWAQCLILAPEKKYRFSAWIKVESEGDWITLYYQGDRNGHPHGVKLGGSHAGVKDWTYFEQEFIAPKFDERRACFHPLRLLALGNAWFHSADLQLVE